jgi:hypothetical protein
MNAKQMFILAWETMTPEEIRAEVERRRQRARDLKIRETLWDLEKTFRGHRIWLRDDLQFGKRLVYPGIELASDEARFPLGQEPSKLTYRKGKVESEEYGDVESTTTHGTITLKLNDDSVFEFEVAETIEYLPDSPGFSERLGEITGFIEGPWVTEIAEFVQKVDAHAKSAWKERNAPREAREAEDLRKRFGL